jgi:hypothetical protein
MPITYIINDHQRIPKQYTDEARKRRIVTFGALLLSVRITRRNVVWNALERRETLPWWLVRADQAYGEASSFAVLMVLRQCLLVKRLNTISTKKHSSHCIFIDLSEIDEIASAT